MEAALASAAPAVTTRYVLIPNSERPEAAPFIVGVSRSGTTLLRLMLDAHPDVSIPPETHCIPRVAETCSASWRPVEDFVATVCSSPTWNDLHIEKRALEERIGCIVPFEVGDALRVMYRIYAEQQGKRRWGDKTPNYLTSMRLIQKLLPEARFIHVVRDGRDVALSIRHLWFGPDSLQDAASWWASRLQAATEQSQGLASYLVIRYEDLVLETEATLRQICNFLSLSWDGVMLDYHTRSRQRLAELSMATTAGLGGRRVSCAERRSIHALTALPPQPERVGQWKREMSADECESFEVIAGEMLQAFDYEIATAQR